MVLVRTIANISPISFDAAHRYLSKQPLKTFIKLCSKEL